MFEALEVLEWKVATGSCLKVFLSSFIKNQSHIYIYNLESSGDVITDFTLDLDLPIALRKGTWSCT